MVADRRSRLMLLLKFQRVSTPMEKKTFYLINFKNFMFLLLFNAFKVYTDAFYEKIYFLIF